MAASEEFALFINLPTVPVADETVEEILASTVNPSAFALPATSKAVLGDVVPMPTLLAETSTNNVPESKFASPEISRLPPVNLPTARS